MEPRDLFEEFDAGAPLGGAHVVRFPIHRNIGKARRVAEVLSKREGATRQAYWRRTCEDLATMLERRGADEAEIDRQLERFRDVVTSIMSEGRPLRGGGDAA